VLVAAAGWTPLARDLPDYFVPMRAATAEALLDGRVPWLNPANGCGEPWFANPQTGVLYPLHWLYLALPAGTAVATEIALHLCLLSLGMGLWTRRLGGSRVAQRLAEAVGWACGPVLATVGMVNNLDTLAWLPWMALTASAGRWRWLAALTALAWLAGEPQVWALGCCLALTLAAQRRRAALALAGGAALAAVQMVPFLAWVRTGNRGPDVEPRLLLSGAVDPLGWLAVLVPGAPTTQSSPWAGSLLLGPVLLVCLVLGARAAPWRLRVWIVVVAAVATLPVVANGAPYLALSRGLLRYPSRFAVVALTVAVPLVALGGERLLDDRRRWPAVAAALLAVMTAGLVRAPWALGVVAVTALAAGMTALWPRPRGWRVALLAVAVLLLLVDGIALLGLAPTADAAAARPVWTGAPENERIHVPRPTGGRFDWVLGPRARRRAWPLGYLNRIDGLTVTTTPAPVVPARLETHLRHADSGPAGRWWLDALACPWVVLPTVQELPDLEPVAVWHGVWLHRNERAWPVLGRAAELPEPGVAPRWLGGAEVTAHGPEHLELVVDGAAASWLVVSQTPLPGWRWRVDGVVTTPESGAGIVHGIRLEPGRHKVEACYLPAGVRLGGCLSLLAFAALAASLRISWRPSAVRSQVSSRDRSSERFTSKER
jgi:hypothetical protein